MKTLGTKVNDYTYQKFQELSDKQNSTVSMNLRNLVENSLNDSSFEIQNQHVAIKNDTTTQSNQCKKNPDINHLLGCIDCQVWLTDHDHILISSQTWNKVKKYV